ncbi:MAG: type IV toxin-antitoxin system AbiEi family antitoxin [Deferrisomatales bacterium]
MDSRDRGKLNRLLAGWPRGTVITSARLGSLGISRQLADKYVQSRWLERHGTGAFVRAGEPVDWVGGLYALQTQLEMTVHVGAGSALELLGRSHFVPMGPGGAIRLVSERSEHLPAWFRRHDWGVRIEHHCLGLFDRLPEEAAAPLDCGGFSVSLASAERAILEEIRLATTNEAVEHACQLVEGLTLLRPAVTQELLESCRSVRVKRLFLWAAETAGHPWFDRLDLSRIDLGKGKQQVYRGGRFDPKYRITVPAAEELPGV